MSDSSSSTEYPAFRQALRVGLVYLVVSVLWIYLSDLAVERWLSDPGAIRRAQTLKGWAFVGASAALIVFLVHRELTRVREVGDRFRALVEQSLAGVYLIQGGRFRYVNPTLARIFGYEPEEMIAGMEVKELVVPEDREKVLGAAATRGRVGDELHFRFRGLRKDGEPVAVEVHGSRITWQGRPAVLGMLLDVGERDRLERQIRESQKMEALGKLTGQVAHDFNNFLTGIVGPLDLCRAILPEGGEARREVEEARETALKAASLSQKLLTFSRRRPALPQTVGVNAAIRDTMPLLGRLVSPSVRLQLELDEQESAVSIDPSALEQVLVNLVMNAGEAIEGEGTVVIRSRRVERDLVRIQVQDDGQGMAESDQAQILQPFFTTKEKGTGLGLSTVFGIVSQAGGRLEVESELGVGSTLTILLPRIEAEIPEKPREGSDSVDSLEGSENVLLVEDEAPVRRTVRKALERVGYAVVSVDTGEAALDAAAGGSLDLLLTDVQLPDVMGPELAREIMGSHPGIGVLYMSGFSEREITRSLATDPRARLLEKPFSMDELLRAVRRALEDRDGEGRALSSEEAV